MHLFSISSLFSPVIDSKEQLRRHILWFLFIRVLFFTLLLGISVFFKHKGHNVHLPTTPIVLAFLSFVYIYTIVSAVILQTSLRIRRFGLIQLLSDTCFAALLVYGTGCGDSIFTPVFILPIINGGLVLHRIGGLIPAAAATFLYATVLTAEHLNYLPPYLATEHHPKNILATMNVFSVYGLTFFLTALLSGMLAARLRSAEDALTETSLQLDRLSLLYRQIFNDINSGIITIDGIDTISSCNPAAEKITGYRADDLLGKRFASQFPDLDARGSGRYVADLTKKDGSKTRVGYSFSNLNMACDQTPDNPASESCQILTMQDISKIEQMERQIMEAENMAAIGKLSASIAHDFRNPLAAISGCAQILSAEFNAGNTAPPETQKRLMEIILRESERMAKTITDFLQFARPAPIQSKWCDLKKLVEEIVDTRIASSNHHPGCNILIELEDRLDIWGDRQQIQTALTHLIDNACQATSNTTKPVLICANEDTWRGNNIILIEVVDKGRGMTTEIQGKVFEPFYSTREDGTGLGLAIVKHIITNHHGSVEIFSIKDQGCTVRLRLPLPDDTTTPESS